MRKRFVLCAGLLLALGLAGPAAGAVLPVNATLSIAIGDIGTLSLSGSGSGTSNGAFALATLPGGLISLTTDLSVPIAPPAIGLSKITVMASPTNPVVNQAGSFAPGGNMGNTGIANLFFTNGGSGGIVLLKYVGAATGVACVVPCAPNTVIGASWTNLGVTAGDPTRVTALMAVAAGIPVTVTVTAFDKRTAGGAGTLQLVAPASIKLFAGNLGSLPLVGTLTLQFVPEPGTLLLLGSGVVALVASRRHARRSH